MTFIVKILSEPAYFGILLRFAAHIKNKLSSSSNEL